MYNKKRPFTIQPQLKKNVLNLFPPSSFIYEWWPFQWLLGWWFVWAASEWHLLSGRPHLPRVQRWHGRWPGQKKICKRSVSSSSMKLLPDPSPLILTDASSIFAKSLTRAVERAARVASPSLPVQWQITSKGGRECLRAYLPLPLIRIGIDTRRRRQLSQLVMTFKNG